MQYIEAKQGLMADLIRPQKKETNIIPDERSIIHNGCSHGDSPISQLIPGEKVSCITESNGQDEKANSNDPIELPGGPVGTCVKDPDHMQEDRHDHPVSSPPMEVSQNLPVKYKGEDLHIEVGPLDRGRVEEHQKNTGDSEDDEEETRNAPQTEGIGESKAMAFDLHREDMEKEVVEHEHGPFQVGVRYSSSKNGTPYG